MVLAMVLLDSKTTPAYFGSMVNVEHRSENETNTEIRAFSIELEEENHKSNKIIEGRADNSLNQDMSALFDIENFIKTRR